MLAPVLPLLTDGAEQLDAAIASIAAAGATHVTVCLFIFAQAHGSGSWRGSAATGPISSPPTTTSMRAAPYLPPAYRDWLADRVRPLLARHGLDQTPGPRDEHGPVQAGGAEEPVQLTLL